MGSVGTKEVNYMAACRSIDKDMFSCEVISVDRVCSFMSVGRRSVFFHYINVSVLLEVPNGGLSYILLHRQITTPRSSFFKTTIILHWWHEIWIHTRSSYMEKDILAAI